MSSKFLLGFCADSSDVHRRGAGANTRPGPASSAKHPIRSGDRHRRRQEGRYRLGSRLSARLSRKVTE
jgi:hypothetical protein